MKSRKTENEQSVFCRPGRPPSVARAKPSATSTFDHLYAADRPQHVRYLGTSAPGARRISPAIEKTLTDRLNQCNKENRMLKDLMLVNLDLIQQQSDRLLSKDKTLAALKQENATLKYQVENDDELENVRDPFNPIFPVQMPSSELHSADVPRVQLQYPVDPPRYYPVAVPRIPVHYLEPSLESISPIASPTPSLQMELDEYSDLLISDSSDLLPMFKTEEEDFPVDTLIHIPEDNSKPVLSDRQQAILSEKAVNTSEIESIMRDFEREQQQREHLEHMLTDEKNFTCDLTAASTRDPILRELSKETHLIQVPMEYRTEVPSLASVCSASVSSASVLSASVLSASVSTASVSSASVSSASQSSASPSSASLSSASPSLASPSSSYAAKPHQTTHHFYKSRNGPKKQRNETVTSATISPNTNSSPSVSSRSKLNVNSGFYDGALTERMKLIDPTPVGQDPYQLGDADVREQSPIQNFAHHFKRTKYASKIDEIMFSNEEENLSKSGHDNWGSEIHVPEERYDNNNDIELTTETHTPKLWNTPLTTEEQKAQTTAVTSDTKPQLKARRRSSNSQRRTARIGPTRARKNSAQSQQSATQKGQCSASLPSTTEGGNSPTSTPMGYPPITNSLRHTQNVCEPSSWALTSARSSESQEPEIIQEVEVPQWRFVNITTSIESTDQVENLSDEIFEKRHRKMEHAEKRQKRWDMQRTREQIQVQHLRLRQPDAPWYHRPPMTPEPLEPYSFLPGTLCSIERIEVIEEDQLPVSAFGHNIPHLPERVFYLPWIRSSKPPKKNRTKKVKVEEEILVIKKEHNDNGNSK